MSRTPAADPCCQLIVVRRYHATEDASEQLADVEPEHRGDASPLHFTPAPASTETVGTVLNDSHRGVLATDGIQLIEVYWIAEDRGRDDSAGARCNRRLDEAEVHVEVMVAAVDEDRLVTAGHDRMGNDHASVRRADHFAVADI